MVPRPQRLTEQPAQTMSGLSVVPPLPRVLAVQSVEGMDPRLLRCNRWRDESASNFLVERTNRFVAAASANRELAQP